MHLSMVLKDSLGVACLLHASSGCTRLDTLKSERRSNQALQEASDEELHAFRWHELLLRINTGAPCSRAIGSQWWDDYHELEGPNWAFPQGFQVCHLAGRIGATISLLLMLPACRSDQPGLLA